MKLDFEFGLVKVTHQAILNPIPIDLAQRI